MRFHIIATLLVVAGTATAAQGPATAPGPTTIRLGKPAHGRLDGLMLEIHATETLVHVTMTLALGSPATDVQTAPDLWLPLDVPHDAVITDLDIRLGAARAAFAAAERAPDARETYHSLVEMRRDPALLEWTSGTARRDRLRLHVFPVLADAPATVTIHIFLPHDTKQVVIESGEHRIASAEVAPGDTYEPWTEPWKDLRVDRHTSLVAREPYAAPAFVDPDPEVLHGHAPVRPVPTGLLSTADLDVAVEAHATPLAHCYAYGRELDPALSGSIQLVVAAARDGAVSDVRIEGLDSAAVTGCIADEIAGWKLRATGHADTVRTRVELSRLR